MSKDEWHVNSLTRLNKYKENVESLGLAQFLRILIFIEEVLGETEEHKRCFYKR